MTGLNIATNLIQGYSIGMYITGGATAGSVHDNRFQGDGGPLTGLGNGVNSESSHVLIQNNIFDGIYSGVLNLFPFGPNPVDLDTYVIGNTLTNNAAARPARSIRPRSAPTLSAPTITRRSTAICRPRVRHRLDVRGQAATTISMASTRRHPLGRRRQRPHLRPGRNDNLTGAPQRPALRRGRPRHGEFRRRHPHLPRHRPRWWFRRRGRQ